MTERTQPHTLLCAVPRKNMIAALAAGAPITGFRVMPFPHRYSIVVRGIARELESSDVQALVDEKVIAGQPRDMLWDTIDFRVTDNAWVLSEVFAYFPRGFGYCAVCGELLEPSKVARSTDSGTATPSLVPPTAARHGFQRGPDRKEITPACEGSNKPLVDTLLPDAGAKHVAA